MIVKQIKASSFRATAQYLLHDKGAATSERVAWTALEGCYNSDPHRVAAEMRETAAQARELKRAAGLDASGRPVKNPALHVALSWAKDEAPDQAQMLAAAQAAMKQLGLVSHQAMIVAHRDEPQPHVHILANRIDRETGRANRLAHSQRKLSAWALRYEQAQGQIRCQQRAENQRKREAGDKPRYGDAVITQAWQGSDSGKTFQQALAEQGCTLAMGRKRVVVVDREGKAVNPVRELKEVKSAAFMARLSDLDLSRLPDAEAVRRQRQAGEARGDEGRTVGEKKAGTARADTETPNRQTPEPEAPERETPDRESRDGGTPAARYTGWEKPAPGFDRDRYHADWQAKIDQAGIDKAVTTEARERFGKAAGEEDTRAPANDNARLADLERRQLDERRTLEQSQDVRRLAHEEQLSAQYSCLEERERLEALEGKRWQWTGDRERMDALRRTIENAGQRAGEARSLLSRTFAREREQLEARHGEERRQLTQGPAHEKAGLEQQAPIPENANSRRAELQSRHLEQQGQLNRVHAQRRLRQSEALGQYYDTALLREELEHLEAKRSQREQDRERQEELRLSIENAEQRAAEARAGLDQVCAGEHTQLEQRQQREREALERQLGGQEAAPETGHSAEAERRREAAQRSPAPAPAPPGRTRRR